MNLETINWNLEYDNFINYLFSLQDLKYKEFQFKLLNDNINLIGIKTPILKKIAKKISKGNYISFINNNKHNYYEEIVIHGLIVGYVNDINLLDGFFKYISNWAITDIVASNIKYFKKNQENGFKLINKYIKSSNSWTIRFGYVLFLNNYINDLYIDKIILKIKENKCNDYYVEMAIAWLISICFINYKEKIINLFEENVLSKFIINKSISKINDSYRINKIDKEYIKKYKVY